MEGFNGKCHFFSNITTTRMISACSFTSLDSGFAKGGNEKETDGDSVVSAFGDTELDINPRINTPKFIFAILSKIWKSNYLNINVKLRLFRTNRLKDPSPSFALCQWGTLPWNISKLRRRNWQCKSHILRKGENSIVGYALHWNLLF